ncbi:MAG: glutamate 5-kinase [Candidatus Goldbacteria bacterium]|nr:glutamate 5-kinase [Candidatus Goldiibacteriota bacterium]
MYERILIKVGTSLLTDEHGLKKNFLNSFVSQISGLNNNKEIIIVSSGAIGTGIAKLGLTRKSFGLAEKQAIAAVGQITLMNEYEILFNKYGVTIGQVLIEHEDVKNKIKKTNVVNTLNKLIEWKVIPVINENDTVATEEIKFGDNDTLAGIVADLLNVDLVIILTSVDGVYDKNPHKFKDARLIKKIDDIDSIIKIIKADGKTLLGTGGMLTKLEIARKLNNIGIPVVIANGNKEKVIEKIVAGKKEGTVITGKDVKIKGKKRWIFMSLKTKGEIKIDDGAKDAVLKRGKSLLAVGITDVSGEFSFGDAAEVVDKNGKKIGKGIVNYSSDVLKNIKGKKNSEIEKLLGDNFYQEVIHRDNLFLY